MLTMSKYNKLSKQITYHENGTYAKKVSTKMEEECECTTYYENGERISRLFKNGRPTCIWMTWDKNGDYDWINMDVTY